MKFSEIPKNKKILFLATSIAIILLVASYFIFSDTKEKPKRIGKDEIITISTDDPDETPLDNYIWKGADTDPKYISLPTIKGGGYIQKVGIDQRNEVAVPTNVNLAGWFIKTSIPGEKGLSIIVGHVDGRSKPGIFKNIEKLKTGDTFTVELGNGKTTKFKVTSQTKINSEKAPSVLFSQHPQNISQLNLITCGGEYDRKARRYLDRIIITSIPINS